MAAKGRQTSATGPSTGAQHQGPLGRTACGSLKPSWPRAELSVTSQIAEGSRKRRIFFLFYSNDHAPIHIHVRRGGGEAVFDLDNGVELRESQGMKLSDIAKAEAIATEYKQLMIKKWHEPLD